MAPRACACPGSSQPDELAAAGRVTTAAGNNVTFSSAEGRIFAEFDGEEASVIYEVLPVAIPEGQVNRVAARCLCWQGTPQEPGWRGGAGRRIVPEMLCVPADPVRESACTAAKPCAAPCPFLLVTAHSSSLSCPAGHDLPAEL